MKKLIFPLFVALMIAACKNDPAANTGATSSTATPAEQPAEIKIDPAQVKEASAKATASMEQLNSLKQELSTISAANLPEDQKKEVESIRGMVNDLTLKQEIMTKGLEAAANATGGAEGNTLNTNVPPPGVLQDYVQSVGNYDKLIEEARAKISTIKGGKQ